jgi:ribosomal protein S19
MRAKVILIKKRDAIITPNLVNKRFFVYNGKHHVFVKSSPTLLGRIVGALAPTKKLGRAIHDSVKNRKKKKKKKK